MDLTDIHAQLERAVRRVLSDQNRDPYAPAHGCFDRRYWAWKLVDFPEATFQRQVLLLAWRLPHAEPPERAVLQQAIEAGLMFTASVQHKDGSWDQAFPHEHSFGGTAFLLQPLLDAYRDVRDDIQADRRAIIETSLRRAAEFLCKRREEHGHIANHLAGAVLSLVRAGEFFGDPRYLQRADELLGSILAQQSTEGWFVEYEGADPGYQTLCIYYLAQVEQLRPSPGLRDALDRSVEFLSWFVHPDGTFGGEYGSRRTAVFYPGGIALLAASGNAVAGSMLAAMTRAVGDGHTVRLDQVDAGNLAPLAANYITLLRSRPAIADAAILPSARPDASADFPDAGVFVRATPEYYAVIGASNGGVLKVFDRASGKLRWNDGGYVGQTVSGAYLTTQATQHRNATATSDEINIDARFCEMPRVLPSPSTFLVLRLLNITVMRSVRIGNAVKRMLVKAMITGGAPAGLTVQRRIRFTANQVVITDRLQSRKQLHMRWLECGKPFVAIHMASARYYEHSAAAGAVDAARSVDVTALQENGEVVLEFRV